ncbi:hypothetical protein GCM10029964_085990 [Kibdelosporangium lantanae]
MRLTLRDGFAAVVMALIVLVYVLYLNGTDFLLVSGVRATATTMLVLGVIGCALGDTDELYTTRNTATPRSFAIVASLLGGTALATAVFALIGGGEVMLAVFFAATAALWLLATTRHLLGVGRAGKPVVERRKEART